MKISKNKDFKEEYCCTVCRIGETFPIEGRDRIVKTLVNGLSIIIGKDEFKTGDVAVYCSNETQLHELFLHLNSMYDTPELNTDQEKRGYINKYGRVKMIRLGGIPSYGLLLNPETISLFLNEPVEDVKKYLEQHIGEDFDEINDERFVQVYIPPVKENASHGQKLSKQERLANKLKRFKMLIEGSFRFHYDTQQLAKNMRDINPDDVLDISVKVHGTSAIFTNILTNVPDSAYAYLNGKKNAGVKKVGKKLLTKKPLKVKKSEMRQAYNLVYASRKIVKNEFINKDQNPGGFYGDDIWAYWAKRLKGLVPRNYCIYCEIVGYNPNKGTYVQKDYDYGCKLTDKVTSKLMVYRVTRDGKEMNISDVIKFGNRLRYVLGDTVMEFPLLYHGTLADFYPQVSVDSHWHENVLELLKEEKRFHMEEIEPMCKNKVYREGVVVRKENDPIAEAWKLKCSNFLLWEGKNIDKGEIDTEMGEQM